MKQGKTISKNNKPKPPRGYKSAPKTAKKITESYLHNAGLYYLERFSSSAENFRRVILRKVHKSCAAHPDQDYEQCATLVDTLVDKFIDLDLLNDQNYTRAMLTTLRRRGKSKRYIIAHLNSKGLNADTIQTALQNHEHQHKAEDGNTDKSAAMIFARKKRIGPFRGEKEKNSAKELGSLARAGFSYEIAKKIIDQQK